MYRALILRNNTTRRSMRASVSSLIKSLCGEMASFAQILVHPASESADRLLQWVDLWLRQEKPCVVTTWQSSIAEATHEHLLTKFQLSQAPNYDQTYRKMNSPIVNFESQGSFHGNYMYRSMVLWRSDLLDRWSLENDVGFMREKNHLAQIRSYVTIRVLMCVDATDFKTGFEFMTILWQHILFSRPLSA